MSVSQHTEQNTSNFKVILSSQYGTVERYCQKIMIPGIAVAPALSPIGYNVIKNPGDKIEFDSLRLEVLMDREMDSFLEIYNLFIQEVDPEDGTLEPLKVIFDTKVMIFNNARIPILELKFENSFITKVDGFMMDTTSTNIVTFGLELVYEQYKIRSLTRTTKT